MSNMNTPSWLGEADPGRRQALERALNVSGAGSVLLQTFINRVVQQLTLRMLGVQSTLNKRPGTGDAAYVNRRTAPGTGATWVADTGTATEVTGTYAQASFIYRTLITAGRVTRKLQATGRSYGDSLAAEISAKADDFAEVYEDGLILGDTAANAQQINGLMTLINATSSQVVANTTAALGDALDLNKLDETIDVVKGPNSDKIIYVSQLGGRKLNAALQAQQQFENVTEIAAGFRVRTYDGIPIVKTTSLPDTFVWDGISSVNAFTGGTTSAIMVVSKRYNWIEELTATTVSPLANTDSQFDEFHMFVDTALVVANTLGAAILGGII